MQCSLAGFAEPDGGGSLFIAAGFLEADVDDLVRCSEGLPFIASFIIDGNVVADFSGNEVRFSADGGPPEACSGRLVGSDGFFVLCPICFVTPPQEMAIQLEGDDGVLSNATCVDTSGV